MTIELILAQIEENRAAGKGAYEGLTHSEIGEYSRYLMFGENHEAFPSEEEWRAWVD